MYFYVHSWTIRRISRYTFMFMYYVVYIFYILIDLETLYIYIYTQKHSNIFNLSCFVSLNQCFFAVETPETIELIKSTLTYKDVQAQKSCVYRQYNYCVAFGLFGFIYAWGNGSRSGCCNFGMSYLLVFIHLILLKACGLSTHHRHGGCSCADAVMQHDFMATDSTRSKCCDLDDWIMGWTG